MDDSQVTCTRTSLVHIQLDTIIENVLAKLGRWLCSIYDHGSIHLQITVRLGLTRANLNVCSGDDGRSSGRQRRRLRRRPFQAQCLWPRCGQTWTIVVILAAIIGLLKSILYGQRSRLALIVITVISAGCSGRVRVALISMTVVVHLNEKIEEGLVDQIVDMRVDLLGFLLLVFARLERNHTFVQIA